MNRWFVGVACLGLMGSGGVGCGGQTEPQRETTDTTESTAGGSTSESPEGSTGAGETETGEATTSTGSTSGAADTGSTTSDDPPAEGSPGCRGDAPKPGRHDRELEWDGEARTYEITIPGDDAGDEPRPLVLWFHPIGGEGSGFEVPPGLEPPPIVVGPDVGQGGTWEMQDELPFVDALLEAVGEETCVDLNRIFVVGHSNGGFMADAMACLRSEVVRGVAVFAGGRVDPIDLADCGPAAMFISHNQNDASVLVSSGEMQRDAWLTIDDCADASQPISPDPCVMYQECAQGGPVVWCSPESGGHGMDAGSLLAVPHFFESL